MPKKPDDIAEMKGLPADLTSEKFILGSILLSDGAKLPEVAGALKADEFSLMAHRTIFQRMVDLHEHGTAVNVATLAQELIRHNELEIAGGLSGLAELDTGLPKLANIDSFVRIVKDKADLRRIAFGAQSLLDRALMASESPDDVLAGGRDLLRDIGAARPSGPDDGLMSAGDFIRGFPGGWAAFTEPSRRAAGLRTGFARLDEMTGGLRPGELIILGARPGAGKSACSLQMAWYMAGVCNIPVGFFSLEMSRESLLLRVLCASARVDAHRLRLGYTNEEERQKIRTARARIVEAPLYIDDAASIGLMELEARIEARERKSNCKLGLVVVDYLQLMSTRGKAENRNQEITKLTRGLKLMAKERECPFLVLSQLARESEKRPGDKRPQLQDLRDSGSIESDADVVMAIHRPELHARDRTDLIGLAELLVLKQRSGPVGTVPLTFLAQLVKFETRAEAGDVPPEEPTHQPRPQEESGRLPYAE